MNAAVAAAAGSATDDRKQPETKKRSASPSLILKKKNKNQRVGQEQEGIPAPVAAAASVLDNENENNGTVSIGVQTSFVNDSNAQLQEVLKSFFDAYFANGKPLPQIEALSENIEAPAENIEAPAENIDLNAPAEKTAETTVALNTPAEKTIDLNAPAEKTFALNAPAENTADLNASAESIFELNTDDVDDDIEEMAGILESQNLYESEFSTQSMELNCFTCAFCHVLFSTLKNYRSHLCSKEHRDTCLNYSSDITTKTSSSFNGNISTFVIKNLKNHLIFDRFFKEETVQSDIRRILEGHLEILKAIKLQFKLHSVYSKLNEIETIVTESMFFSIKMRLLTVADDIDEFLSAIQKELENSIENFASKDSGWSLTSIREIHLQIFTYMPLEV